MPNPNKSLKLAKVVRSTLTYSARQMDTILDKLSELSQIWRQTTPILGKDDCFNDEDFDIFTERRYEYGVSDGNGNFRFFTVF